MNSFGSIDTALTAAVRRPPLIALLLVVLALSLPSPRAGAQTCALVTNTGSMDISLIDTVSNTIVSTIPVGLPLRGIAITPNGLTAYAANDTCGVSVIDLGSNSVVTNIMLNTGCAIGGGLAITPNGRRVYVPRSFGVAVIDTASNTVLTTVPIASSNPPNIAITRDGAFAYVAGADGSNNVTVIDTATDTVVDTFLTGVGPTTPYGIAFAPIGVRDAFDPNEERAYVTNNASESMDLALIEATAGANALITNIPLDGRPTGVAVAPDGKLAYVLNGSDPSDLGTNFEISLICVGQNGLCDETNVGTVVGHVPVGGLMYQIAVTADGAQAYAPNYALRHIAVVSTADFTFTTIPGGVNPFGVAIKPVGSCSPGLQIVNEELSGEPDPSTFAFDPTLVPGGVAGMFSFTAEFCNVGRKQVTDLKSVTTSLTDRNVLHNRDSAAPTGVGSLRTFPMAQGFADGVLSPGECVDVIYQIGLAAKAPFEFLVDVVGTAD